jgi:hypothetical protein
LGRQTISGIVSAANVTGIQQIVSRQSGKCLEKPDWQRKKQTPMTKVVAFKVDRAPCKNDDDWRRTPSGMIMHGQKYYLTLKFDENVIVEEGLNSQHKLDVKVHDYPIGSHEPMELSWRTEDFTEQPAGSKYMNFVYVFLH